MWIAFFRFENHHILFYMEPYGLVYVSIPVYIFNPHNVLFLLVSISGCSVCFLFCVVKIHSLLSLFFFVRCVLRRIIIEVPSAWMYWCASVSSFFMVWCIVRRRHCRYEPYSVVVCFMCSVFLFVHFASIHIGVVRLCEALTGSHVCFPISMEIEIQKYSRSESSHIAYIVYIV